MAAAAMFGVGLTDSPTAKAATDHFCGFLYPGQVCINSYKSHWDRVRSRYPGHQAHNVFACVYMWNFRTGQMRGGTQYCAYTWSNPTWNPMGHNYGVTTQSDYKSLNHYPNCCNSTAHTLVGWTSDNQTD